MRRGTDIGLAADIILKGGVIAYPTETVYGIGALATDVKAISRVFKVKRRPESMPLSIAVSSIEMLQEVAEIVHPDFIEKFLPGPVTVILRKKPVLPDSLTAGSDYVGIRFPDHPVALDLIRRTGPIVSTSANLHGEPDPVTADEVTVEVDYLLEGGRAKYAGSSTIVDLREYKVLRKGAMYDEVEEYMRKTG
ncbi:L-threonylcarbamoyladenylate synthase [Methanocella arvoryzae]|uniref:L-threonylcarbamoyladenylate synthase n=1 Tax=Methanocella arvoryzae (strain DSM 22066 / NBRC 105507 / MRE50) TaxID=351160 RepID=Q0W259_METAR|nr:L-threonylcarbamoyladenylate synthase [Methanocella arvoryzae]CAJ37534.1 putative translation factor (YrdC family) [Methanocella arvoryzae MRE50]